MKVNSSARRSQKIFQALLITTALFSPHPGRAVFGDKSEVSDTQSKTISIKTREDVEAAIQAKRKELDDPVIRGSKLFRQFYVDVDPEDKPLEHLLKFIGINSFSESELNDLLNTEIQSLYKPGWGPTKTYLENKGASTHTILRQPYFIITTEDQDNSDQSSAPQAYWDFMKEGKDKENDDFFFLKENVKMIKIHPNHVNDFLKVWIQNFDVLNPTSLDAKLSSACLARAGFNIIFYDLSGQEIGNLSSPTQNLPRAEYILDSNGKLRNGSYLSQEYDPKRIAEKLEKLVTLKLSSMTFFDKDEFEGQDDFVKETLSPLLNKTPTFLDAYTSFRGHAKIITSHDNDSFVPSSPTALQVRAIQEILTFLNNQSVQVFTEFPFSGEPALDALILLKDPSLYEKESHEAIQTYAQWVALQRPADYKSDFTYLMKAQEEEYQKLRDRLTKMIPQDEQVPEGFKLDRDLKTISWTTWKSQNSKLQKNEDGTQTIVTDNEGAYQVQELVPLPNTDSLKIRYKAEVKGSISLGVLNQDGNSWIVNHPLSSGMQEGVLEIPTQGQNQVFVVISNNTAGQEASEATFSKLDIMVKE